jgi:hypothetical protein
MPLYERVRGLEGSWEDLVRVDELSELWRSHWDVALIEGSNTDDFDEGSLPELLDGSEFDERDQNFEDRQTGLDASGLIYYPEDTCSVWWDSFRVSFKSARAAETTREVRDTSEQGRLGFVEGGTPPDRFRCLERIVWLLRWLVPQCLALSILEDLACPRCGWCW